MLSFIFYFHDEVGTGILRRTLSAPLQKTLLFFGFDGQVEVGARIVSEEEIKGLNCEHRQKDEVTDVLSFPLSDISCKWGKVPVCKVKDKEADGVVRLGDIVICYAQAARQAKERGVLEKTEVQELLLHGLLHLLGFDHETKAQETIWNQVIERVKKIV